MQLYSLDFPFAYRQSKGSADFRLSNEDFYVSENLGMLPEGEGEHIYLHIQKTGVNTQWLAKQLANFTGVAEMDVGFCGMKDRHAVTRQWFSVYCPKAPAFDWSDFTNNPELDVELLDRSLGHKKLRRGQHKSNTFKIVLRNIRDVTQEALDDILQNIRSQGVPNYFGEQRFGHNGNNVRQAEHWFQRRSEQGAKARRGKPKNIVISAARSYIFNTYLSARVEAGTWLTKIDGDIVDDSGYATGALWGRGHSSRSGASLELQQEVLQPLLHWLNGLEHCGLSQENRPLVLLPNDLRWSFLGNDLTLEFDLQPGQYATAILRELLELHNQALPQQ